MLQETEQTPLGTENLPTTAEASSTHKKNYLITRTQVEHTPFWVVINHDLKKWWLAFKNYRVTDEQGFSNEMESDIKMLALALMQHKMWMIIMYMIAIVHDVLSTEKATPEMEK